MILIFNYFFRIHYKIYLINYGKSTARNLILLLMLLLQNFHALSARSETRSAFRIPLSNNYILILGILAAQGIHILALYLPFMQNLLSLDPVSGAEWIKLFSTATLILVATETCKLFPGKRENNSNCNNQILI